MSQAQKYEKAAQKLLAKARATMEKDLHSPDPAVYLPAFNMIQKAQGGYSLSSQDEGRKFDENLPMLFNQMASGFKDKPVMMSYNLLYAMSKEPIINSIIRTRVAQVGKYMNFAYPDQDVSDAYGIRKVRKPGMTAVDCYRFSYAEEIQIYKINKFLSNCGNRPDYESMNFEDWGKMVCRDSLVYDQWCTEKVSDRLGRPYAFYPVDAKYIRISDSIDSGTYEDMLGGKGETAKIKKGNFYPAYVQIIDNRIVSEFYPDELCFGVRNKVTSLESNGYGVSELEEMISVITSLLDTKTYNANNFKNGTLPKGFFKVSPNTSPARLEEFRQSWYNTMRGVMRSGSVPVLPSEKVEWINMQENNKDMEFDAWLELNIKISCALFLIDPAEINFPLAGDSGRHMFQNGSEFKVDNSKNRGLNPLLKHFSNYINSFLIKQINPDFEFYFRGVDDLDLIAKEQLLEKRVRSYLTIDEARALNNLPPLPNGLGTTPLDGGIIGKETQMKQMEQAEKQMQAAQAMQGDPAAPQDKPQQKAVVTQVENDDDTELTFSSLNNSWKEFVSQYNVKN